MKATKQQLIKTMNTPSEHHIFSPSGSAQWLSCGMSIWEQYGLPDTTSSAAQEGTTAHELAEKALKLGKHPVDFGDRYPDEMVDEITKYVDYVDAIVEGNYRG